MDSIKEKLEDTMIKIDTVVELFYQQRLNEALNQFMDILGNISDTVDALFAYQDEKADFSVDDKRISEMLTEAMSALEERDYVLMADVLQYDFREYLQELNDGIVDE